MPNSLPTSTTQLLDVQATADECGVSASTVRRLSDSGKMPPPVRLGVLVRWRRSTGDPATGIEDWIADGCKPVRHVTAKGVRRA